MTAAFLADSAGPDITEWSCPTEVRSTVDQRRSRCSRRRPGGRRWFPEYLRHVSAVAYPNDAGVGYHDVEAHELARGCANDVLHRCVVTNVGLASDDSSSVVPDKPDCLVEVLDRGVRVSLGSRFRQMSSARMSAPSVASLTVCASRPGGGAGDECDAIVLRALTARSFFRGIRIGQPFAEEFPDAQEVVAGHPGVGCETVG